MTTTNRRNGIAWVCPLFELHSQLGEWCMFYKKTCRESLDPKSPYYEHPCHVRQFLYREWLKKNLHEAESRGVLT